MNEYTFQDHSGNEFQFQGDLILGRTKPIEIDQEFERDVKLRVYGIESGGYVCMLEYASNAPDENAVSSFEVIDLLQDVESFFLVFEANDVFNKTRRLTREEAEQQQVVGRNISSKIETLVFELLDDLQNAAESKGFIDKPVEKKKSIWGLLG